MPKIKTPWTDEQVAALNVWQNTGHVHPFTCGNNRSDPLHVAYQKAHGGDLGELVATRDGWRCPACGYAQDWAHDFMFEKPPELPPEWEPGQIAT